MKNKLLSLVAISVFAMQACSGGKSTVTLKGSDNPSSASSTLTSSLQTGTINASSLKLKVYKFAVSESVTCSSPIVIFENAAGEEKNIADAPTFGSGTVESASYPCVMIEISKVIKTTSASTSGNCTAGVEFSDLICNEGQASRTINGTTVNCGGGASNPQHITLFINTNATNTGGDRALLPPRSATDRESGITLTAPFDVSGDVTGTLTVDLRNFLGSGMDGSTPVCFTSPPPFTFVQ